MAPCEAPAPASSTGLEVGRAVAVADADQAFRAHGAFVYRLLARLGVAEALLDDAVQDVFLIVHRRRHDFDPSHGLRAWLFGISRRVAAAFRRRSRRVERPAPCGVAHETTTPEDQAAVQEAFDFVEEFLRGLSEARRLVFVLTQLEGMTAPEAAAALRINVNTTYSHIRAAREAFRDAIAAAQENGGSRGPA